MLCTIGKKNKEMMFWGRHKFVQGKKVLHVVREDSVTIALKMVDFFREVNFVGWQCDMFCEKIKSRGRKKKIGYREKG